MKLSIRTNLRASGDGACLQMRCPGCRHQVMLKQLGSRDMRFDSPEEGTVNVGNRMCPNTECRAHIFVVYRGNLEIITRTHRSGSTFDSTDLPPSVVEAIEEAIACHSQRCYIAAAIMVRKTLEEVCRDRGAQGENLKQRIASLGNTVVLPQAMLDGLDGLRLLGNDAAHVESQAYDSIGEAEVEVAVDVTKAILKATYQYESIMGRLSALQREEP